MHEGSGLGRVSDDTLYAVLPQRAAADLVVVADVVVTMDAAGTVLTPGAVAVKNGAIVALGAPGEVRARYDASRLIEHANRLLMPGVVNGHTHLAMVLFRVIADDLNLMDSLEHYIGPTENAFITTDAVRWGTRLAIAELIRTGVTCFNDMYMHEDVVAEVAAQAGMRGVVCVPFLDADQDSGRKFALAESLVEKYRNHPLIRVGVSPHAPYTVSPPLFQKIHEFAVKHDLPVHTHLAETRTEEQDIQSRYGATPVRHLENLGFLDERLIAAHCVWPDDEEIHLLARRGVGVVHNPRSNLKLASGVAPIPQMLEAGVTVGLGTDGAASSNQLDMFAELDAAALIHKAVTLNPRVVPAAQGVAMATREGAKAIEMPHVGSLEIGKRADMVVLNLESDHRITWWGCTARCPTSHTRRAAGTCARS
ncbi:MAG: amidohydrolase [Armatimonadetes bacterium]|nr:amidohydrolase [Armatimonadota bacterium]